jgi:haloalkane dehalogenase
MRRAIFISALALGALLVVLYAFGLGVYATSSRDAPHLTQPESPEEAHRLVAEMGLAADYPFQARFVSTSHGRMHYVDAGSGPPLLCVHGNPTWSFLYRHLLRGLSGEARVVAPDLIGFGLSEKLRRPGEYSLEGHVQDLAALVEALDLRDLTLVVHGWGGPVGLGVAVRFPERVRALVVMNSFAFVPSGNGDGFRVPRLVRLARVPVLGEELVQGLGMLHRVGLPAGLARGDRRRTSVLRAYRVVQASWEERAGALAFPRLLPPDAPQEVVQLLEAEDRYLRSFRGPALLLWGGRDRAFGPSMIAAWRERLPQASVIEIPDAGHLLPEDAHEEVTAHVRAFLRANAR